MQRLIAIIGVLSAWSVSAQVAEIRTYGSSGDDALIELREVDNGYLVAGTTASSPTADSDFYLLSLAEDLTVNWSETYGAGGVDQCTGMDTTATGDVLLCGYTNDTEFGDYDASVVRVGSDGTLLWELHYGGTDWDLEPDILALADDGFALIYTTYTDAGDTDVILLRADASGNVVWQQALGDGFNQKAAALTLGHNDELIVGITWATGPDISTERAWIGSFDTDGALLLEGSYGEGRTVLFDVVAHQDAYAGVGFSINVDGERDNVIFKNEPDFSLDWIRLDGDPNDDALHALTSTSVGMMVVGTGNAFGSGGYAAVVQQRTHSGWWSNASSFGFTLDEAAWDVLVDSQNRTLVCGTSNSYSEFEDQDGYLIRFEGVEVSSDYELDLVDAEDETLHIPNFSEAGLVDRLLTNGDRQLEDPLGTRMHAELFNMRGQRVWSGTGTGRLQVPLGSFPSGVYAVRLVRGDQLVAQRWLR